MVRNINRAIVLMLAAEDAQSGALHAGGPSFVADLTDT